MEQREWDERTENRLDAGMIGDGAAAAAGAMRNGVKDGAGRDAWDVFAASGKIQDYLIYRQSGQSQNIY